MDPPSWHPLLSESPGNYILASRWNNILKAIQDTAEGHSHDGADSLGPPTAGKIVAVSSLPTAGELGRIALLTTDNQVYFDTGTAWKRIHGTATLSEADGTVSNPSTTIKVPSVLNPSNLATAQITLATKQDVQVVAVFAASQAVSWTLYRDTTVLSSGTLTGGEVRAVIAIKIKDTAVPAGTYTYKLTLSFTTDFYAVGNLYLVDEAEETVLGSSTAGPASSIGSVYAPDLSTITVSVTLSAVSDVFCLMAGGDDNVRGEGCRNHWTLYRDSTVLYTSPDHGNRTWSQHTYKDENVPAGIYDYKLVCTGNPYAGDWGASLVLVIATP